MMSRVCIALFAVTAVASAAVADGVGVSIDKVTVPIDSITVEESSLRPATNEEMAEKALNGKSEDERLAAVSCVSDQETLMKVIRQDSSSKVRLAAFDRIVDGDLIFRLVFKPGVNAVGDVRPEAVKSVAEVETVKVMAAKSKDESLKKAAQERLESVYASDSDRALDKVHDCVREAASRSAGR